MTLIMRIAEAVSEAIELDDDRVTESLTKAMSERLDNLEVVDEAIADGVEDALRDFDDGDYEVVAEAVIQHVQRELAARAKAIALAELQRMARLAKETATVEQR